MKSVIELSAAGSRRLIIVLAIIAGSLLLVVFASVPVLVRPEVVQLEPAESLRRSLKRFPAAVAVYRRISDIAFDVPVRRPAALWRTAYTTVLHLAPNSTATRRAFVRQGFFHWSELSAQDRQVVLGEAAVLMRQPEAFDQLYRPLWVLTKDFAYLRSAAPRDVSSWQRLMDLAAQSGEFEHYRALRDQLSQIFIEVLREKERRHAPPEEILAELLRIPRHAETREAMTTYIEHLSGAPPSGADVNPDQLATFVDYAIRERLPRLDVFANLAEDDSPLAPALRARLAVAIGNIILADRIERTSFAATPEWTAYLSERAIAEADQGDLSDAEERLKRLIPSEAQTAPALAARAHVAVKRGQLQRAGSYWETLENRFSPSSALLERWSGLCAGLICADSAETFLFSRQPQSASLNLAVGKSGGAPPYVEIFLDDRRVAEGVVPQARRFELDIPAGLHRLRVKLVNPMDLRGERRLLRVE